MPVRTSSDEEGSGRILAGGARLRSPGGRRGGGLRVGCLTRWNCRNSSAKKLLRLRPKSRYLNCFHRRSGSGRTIRLKGIFGFCTLVSPFSPDYSPAGCYKFSSQFLGPALSDDCTFRAYILQRFNNSLQQKYLRGVSSFLLPEINRTFKLCCIINTS